MYDEDALTFCASVQLMSMMPMMGNLGGMGDMADKESQKKLRKYHVMLDSMNAKELDETDSRKLFDPAFVRRIALGSGSSLVRLPCTSCRLCPRCKATHM